MGEISSDPPSIRRFAMMALVASLGWYASQKTYFDLSKQTVVGAGPQGIIPPCRPTEEQHAELALLKPVKTIYKLVSHCTH